MKLPKLGGKEVKVRMSAIFRLDFQVNEIPGTMNGICDTVRSTSGLPCVFQVPVRLWDCSCPAQDFQEWEAK